MELDFGFDGGAPGQVERLAPDTVRFTPFSADSGGQHFACCVRVSGLPPGGAGVLRLRWPPRWTPADAPPDWEPEFVRRATRLDSFLLALDRCCVFRPDGGSWRRLPGVTLDPTRDEAALPIPGNGLVATQLPYTWADLQALASWSAARPGVRVAELGRSRAGLPLRVWSAGNPAPDAPTVYVQAYQHAGEFTGPRVADALARALAERGAAAPLAWQVVPAVDADALRHGPAYLLGPHPHPSPRRRNPNRDWHEGTWPEVAAVRAFLRDQVRSGRRYVLGLDLHNGWDGAQTSGACYTVAPATAPEAYRRRQHAFVDWMYHRTDHTQPGHYWAHDTGGRGFAAFFAELTGALAHTVEFSRHLWWDRAAQAYHPADPSHPPRFAAQALDAIEAFFTQPA